MCDNRDMMMKRMFILFKWHFIVVFNNLATFVKNKTSITEYQVLVEVAKQNMPITCLKFFLIMLLKLPHVKVKIK